MEARLKKCLQVGSCVLFVAGIISAKVALLAEKADVEYNPSYTDSDSIIRQIVGCGFGATLLETKEKDDLSSVDIHVCIPCGHNFIVCHQSVLHNVVCQSVHPFNCQSKGLVDKLQCIQYDQYISRVLIFLRDRFVEFINQRQLNG